MKPFATFVSLLFLLTSCALFRHQPEGTQFSFEFENETYQILGYMSEEGQSANFLVKREGDQTIFRAIDRDQNGIIDQIITGSVGLQEANEIYKEGIRQARELGKHKEIERFREFEHTYREYRLLVQSYIPDTDSYINRFIITDLNRNIISVAWDDESDGLLTRIESGDIDLQAAQALYERILSRAADNYRIETNMDGRYVITTGRPADVQIIRSVNRHSK